VGYYSIIAVIAAVALGLGLIVRHWLLVGIVSLPALLWLVRWVPEWGADQGDGNTGAELFLFGFMLWGLPVIAPVALGVGLGRSLLGSPGAKAGGTTEAPR
jgi:hypothetical protein